ncbi:MAG TPA: M23 family metallopeptidase, partial [Solirubrobacteraceae bacterium]
KAQKLRLPKKESAPTAPATAGVQRDAAKAAKPAKPAKAVRHHARPRAVSKERLFAHPARPANASHGGKRQMVAKPKFTTFKDYFTVALGLKRSDVALKPLKAGSQVIAGTVLGRVGDTVPNTDPHLYFEIRPAGKGAPRVDPKPILDGWKLLEATAIYRAAGKNPFIGGTNPTAGQVLLMSKETLQRRVLNDPHVEIYPCGRRDIAAGVIDRRVLATLEFLVANGLDPTVSALKCGHSFLTTSGNVSEHSSGNAVDIARVNGIPIAGHQGTGSITDITIRRLLTLQGVMKPHQIISLMTFRGADNTLALPDHWNHIHVGFHPEGGQSGKLGKEVAAILKPSEWTKLVSRLGQIQNPTVSVKPSKYAIKDRKVGSGD